MFFGKPKREELKADELDAYAKGLFEKKVARITDRCAAHVARASAALASFETACIAFGNIAADPDPEFVGMASAETLKEQKSRYVKALLSSIGALKGNLANEDSGTRYEAVLAKKRMLEDFIEHALKTNASFRSVLLGFGNHFSTIKRTFNDFENSISVLKTDLDRGTADFSNYETLEGAIAKLASMQREYEMFGNGTGSEHNAVEAQESDDELGAVENAMRDLDSKVYAIEAEARSIMSSINSMLKPIERAARKYDHETKGKQKLVAAIDDPMRELSSESSYNNFLSMLEGLQKDIDNIEASEKERELVKSRVKVVLSSSIFDSVIAVGKLNAQKEQLIKERDTYKVRLAELSKSRESKNEAAIAKQAAEYNRKKLGADISSLVHAIEGLFSSYYGVDVMITL